MLEKPGPKKKPRPIGAGSNPDRKLGSAMLMRASYSDLIKVMVKVMNLCHGGRGACDIIPFFFQMMTECEDSETEKHGLYGIASSDGSNAFGAMKRREVQHGLDMFLSDRLEWMKQMFWRFHRYEALLYYRKPDGKLITLHVRTGFVQGELFSAVWYAIGQGPSFQIMMEEFKPYGVVALPYADDVPFLFHSK